MLTVKPSSVLSLLFGLRFQCHVFHENHMYKRQRTNYNILYVSFEHMYHTGREVWMSIHMNRREAGLYKSAIYYI